MNVQYFRETCAVAELGGEIVGWCSMMPVSDTRYFLHQLGVAPKVRRRGVAASLFVHLLRRLKRRHSMFEIEFTSDRRNSAVLQLNKIIAERMGMRLIKKPDAVQVIEDSEEELYAMAPTLPEENDRAFKPKRRGCLARGAL
jgi:GNAT superfamily N-acetyltransferase